MTEVRGDDDVDFEDQGQVEYEELRPELSTRRKVVVLLVSILVVSCWSRRPFGFWAHRQSVPDSKSTNEIVLDVPTGSSTNSIADLLEKKGVIGNAFLFKLYVRWKGSGTVQGRQLPATGTRAGGRRRPHARGRTASAPDQAVHGSARPQRLRQIPAQVVKDIPTLSVDKLNQAMTDGQARSIFQPQGQGIEGFLFPDTYDIAEGADERAVVQTMVAQFDKVASEVGLPDAQARVGHSPYEALIVASLVEEEAKVDEDRPKIARVIYNRLAQGCRSVSTRRCATSRTSGRVCFAKAISRPVAVQHA